MASQSELSKSPKKSYNSVGKKRARVYAYKDDLIFIGGAEFKGGGDTTWKPYFKLPQEASAKEKGEAILKVLNGYTTGIDNTIKTGDLKDNAILELTGLKDIKQFYKKAKYVFLTQFRDSNEIEIMPSKKERGYGNYTGRDPAIKIPADDVEGLGRGLDKAFEYCV